MAPNPASSTYRLKGATPRDRRSGRFIVAFSAILSLTSCRADGPKTPEESLFELIHAFAPYLYTAFLVAIVSIGIVAIIRRKSQLHSGRGHALLDNLPDETEAIGPLIELLFSPDLEVSAKAATRLVGIIPRVQRSDEVWLTQHQRDCLSRGLHFPDTTLVCQLIELIGKLEDTSWIDKVTELAKLQHEARIAQSATACARKLRRVLDQRGDALLRSTNAVQKDEDSLMRPAALGDVAASASLLRAAEIIQSNTE
jgi:hypothetical protein